MTLFARYFPVFVTPVCVALAIALNFYNNHTSIDVDTADELKG